MTGHSSPAQLRFYLLRFVVFVFLVQCLGCAEEGVPEVERIPAVKTQVVAFGAGEGLRAISGLIEADTTTVLAFPIGGTVSEIGVDIGDKVSAGQVLARLNPNTFDIDVRSAEAQQDAARADLLFARDQVRRLSRLFDQGIVAQVELDNARKAMASADGNLKLAQARLAKARDDRRRSVLVAPFEGTVSARQINPFQEVAPGEPCLTLVGAQGLKARVLVPESLAGNLQVGQAVSVALPSISEARIQARITEIGAVAQAGAAVPVRAALDTDKADGRQILVGTAATMFFPLVSDDNLPVVLIPLSALALNDIPRLSPGGGTGGRAPLFLFDPREGKVERRLVEVSGLQGNMLAVSGGLQPGDEVVVAGVSFLEDGMQARRWEPETPGESTSFTTIDRQPAEQ